jgi:hypothetical protein
VASEYLCPHCGDLVDTDPDPGGGAFQEYIEDCPICCRPNRLQAILQVYDDGYEVLAFPDI